MTEILDCQVACGAGGEGLGGATWGHFSAEHKLRIMRDGLRGDESIAELWRKEGTAQSLY